MTFEERNLQIKVENRDAGFERPQDIKRGEVVEVNGSIEGDLPYLVWVRPLETNATPLQMFNPGTIENLQTEMTVFYRQDPRAPAPWSLLNFDSSTYAQDASAFLTLPGTNNPPHADDHTMAPGNLGPDPLNVFGHAIADFAARPNNPASMKIRIFSGWYPGTSNYEFFVGPVDSKDFTADIPASAGKALVIAIAVDSTGTIQYVNGTEFVDGSPIPAAAKPVVTTEYLLITAIRLVNGMTTIQNENFDHEMRPVFAPGGLSRAIDGARVSKLISPDGLTDPVLSADNSGDVTLAGTGDMILPDKIIHSGDTDTNIAFADDDMEFTAGGLSMLKLTETTQDLITLGPGSGDVDLDFNGDMFLRGSDGFFGIGNAAPDSQLVVTGESFIGPAMASGNTSNGAMTVGLTINQETADDEILSRASSDVAHGMTGITETDIYGFEKKASGASGGWLLTGLTETTVALQYRGLQTTENATVSTAGTAGLMLTAAKKSGTSITSLAANQNLIVFRNNVTTRFIFDSSGIGHADDSWVTFSDERLKTEIIDMPYGLGDLMKLKPRQFLKHSGYFGDSGQIILEDEGTRKIGLLAQEVIDIIPEVIKGGHGDESFYSLDYNTLAALLIKSIQELKKEIEEIKYGLI